MRVEKAPRRALTELAQHLERFVVGLEVAAGARRLADIGHHDAMQLEPAEFAPAHSSWQTSFIDEAIDEGDAAQFGQQRRIEVDLVHAAHDLARACRYLAALARIYLI